MLMASRLLRATVVSFRRMAWQCVDNAAFTLHVQLIFFPSAIGSEPDEPGYNSYPHWARTMLGHAAANLVSNWGAASLAQG